MVDVDERIHPRPGEYVAEKKFASSFFGTDLDAYLKARGASSVTVGELAYVVDGSADAYAPVFDALGLADPA